MTARQEAAMTWGAYVRSTVSIIGLVSSLTYSSTLSQPFSDPSGTSDTPGNARAPMVAANADTDKAVQDLRRKASGGHLHEELELAGDYYIGRGVGRDL